MIALVIIIGVIGFLCCGDDRRKGEDDSDSDRGRQYEVDKPEAESKADPSGFDTSQKPLKAPEDDFS